MSGLIAESVHKQDVSYNVLGMDGTIRGHNPFVNVGQYAPLCPILNKWIHVMSMLLEANGLLVAAY